MISIPHHHPKPALLVIAHPGHELRCHGWLETAQPDVFILTDGSGSSGVPRVHSTAAVVANAGARLLPGSGALADARLYAAVRDADLSFFDILRHQIHSLAGAGYTEVVCDGLEGFNTSHDICHYLARSAAQCAGIPAFDYPLDARPDAWPAQRREVLDEAAVARKLAAANNYPELIAEVRATLARYGSTPFALESFRQLPPAALPPPPPGSPPFYELFGEQRVREGVYLQVIRWNTHVRPMAHACWGCP